MAVFLIMGRLRAAGEVLANLTGSPHFERHAAFQARAVAELISTGFDMADYAQICAKLSEVGFPADLEEELLRKMTMNQGVCEGGSSKLQNYTAIGSYIDCERWAALEKSKLSDLTLFAQLTDFMMALGLRCPSCPTYGVIAAIFLWVKHNGDGIMRITKSEKREAVLQAKALFKERVENEKGNLRISKTIVAVKILPENPKTFFAAYPSFKSVLTINLETIIPDYEYIRTWATTFPLRDRKTRFDCVPALSQSGGGFQSIEGVVRALLHSNSSMLEKFANPSGSPGNGCKLTLLGRAAEQRLSFDDDQAQQLLAIKQGSEGANEDDAMTPSKGSADARSPGCADDLPLGVAEKTPEKSGRAGVFMALLDRERRKVDDKKGAPMSPAVMLSTGMV